MPWNILRVLAGHRWLQIQKLDPNGDLVWARQIGGEDTDEGNSIVVDDLGNVYSTGFFTDTADLDPGPDTLNLGPYIKEDAIRMLVKSPPGLKLRELSSKHANSCWGVNSCCC